MARRFAMWCLRGLGAIAAFVAAVDAVLWLTDWDDALLRPRLVEAAEAAGWQLDFAEPVRLRLLPLPEVRVAKLGAKRPAVQVAAVLDLSIGLSWDRLSSGVLAAEATIGDSRADIGGVAVERIAGRATVDLGLANVWLSASSRIGNETALVTARMSPPDASGHRPAGASLELAGLKAGFDGTLDVLKPGVQASGELTAGVGQLADWLTRLAQALGRPAPDMPPLAAAPFELAAHIDTDLEHRATALTNIALSIGDTRADGAFIMARKPALKIDGRLHFPALSFNKVGTGQSNWIALADLFIARTTAIIDAMPPNGRANLALDIDDASFNGQSTREIALRAVLQSGRGSISHLGARLPGGTVGRLSGTMQGGPGARAIDAHFALEGRRPGETLLWLMPSLAIASTRDAPFALKGEIAPDDSGGHTGTIEATLDGVHGRATATLALGTPAVVTTQVAIEAIDLLSYFSLPKDVDLAGLRLGGLRLDTRLTIDARQASPIAVQEARLSLDELGLRLPAGPESTAALVVDGLPLDLHRLATWLAELPRRAGSQLQDRVRRTVLARMFPAIEGDLSRLDGVVAALNFQTAVTTRVGVVTIGRVQPRSSAVESLGLFGDFELKLASRTKTVGGRAALGVLDVYARLGRGQAQGLRLSRMELTIGAELDRSAPTVRVSELRLGPLLIDGAIEASRHLPLVLHGAATAHADHIDAHIEHLIVADLALMHDIAIKVEAPDDGPLAVRARSEDARARGHRGQHEILHRLSCALPDGGRRPPILKLDVRLAGREPALLRELVAEGNVTADTVRIDDFRLAIGQGSGLASRFVVRAADRAGDKTAVAHVDGCVEGALQTQPMRSTYGESLQGFLLPALSRLSQGESDMFRVGLHGELGIGAQRLAGHAPLKLGIERWRSGGGGKVDSFTVEVERLDLVMPPAGAQRPAMRLSLGRLTLQDGPGTLSFSGPAGTLPLLALEQPSGGSRACDSGAVIRAEMRTEKIDHLEIATVRRAFDRLSALAKGGAPGSRLCNPIALHIVAGEVSALPELIETLTGVPRPADLSRLPRLRNFEAELSIATDRTLGYTIATDVVSPGAVAASCRADTPGLRPPPGIDQSRRRAQGFAAKGTVRLDRDKGQWQGGFSGEFTCIDLADTLAIAAAAGVPLHNPAVSLKAGRVDRLTYALDVPPSATLSDLSQGSGWLDIGGNLALNVAAPMMSFGMKHLHLGRLAEGGLPMTGSIKVSNGDLSGRVLSRDPAADAPGDSHDQAAKWPELAVIEFGGRLTDKFFKAQVLVRSDEWDVRNLVPSYCAAGSKVPIRVFPKFVDRFDACISMAGPGVCPKFEHASLGAGDFPCPSK